MASDISGNKKTKDYSGFGILTAACASRREINNAIGLALSLELHYPDIPRAIVCRRNAISLEDHAALKENFKYVIDERSGISGWHHKLFLDEYSPFSQTLFLDSDMIVVGDISPWIERFREKDFPYWGSFTGCGKLWEGPHIETILQNINRPSFPYLRGGGHYYFDKDSSLFRTAREVAVPEMYRKLIGNYIFTDETAVMVAAAIEQRMIDTTPEVFVAAMDPFLRRNGVILDPVKSQCEIISNGVSCSVTWQRQPWDADYSLIKPAIVHFAGNRDILLHRAALRLLFAHFSERSLPRLPSMLSTYAMHTGRLASSFIGRKVLRLQFKER